jgi:hypothetical protein
MRAPDIAGLKHVMSTMQVITSLLFARVVLSLAGNCRLRAPLAKWRYPTEIYLFRFEIQTTVAVSLRWLTQHTSVLLSNGRIISHDYVCLERFWNGLPYPPPEPHRDRLSQSGTTVRRQPRDKGRGRRLKLTAHPVHPSEPRRESETVRAQRHP